MGAGIFFVIKPPGSVAPKQLFSFTLKVTDTGASTGTPLANNSVTLSLIELTGTGLLVGATTRNTDSNGIVTFTVSISQVGTYKIQANISDPTTDFTTSDLIIVTASSVGGTPQPPPTVTPKKKRSNRGKIIIVLHGKANLVIVK